MRRLLADNQSIVGQVCGVDGSRTGGGERWRDRGSLRWCCCAQRSRWPVGRLRGSVVSSGPTEHTAASIWSRAATPGATTPLPLAMAAATTLRLKLPAPAVAHAAAPAADAAAVDPDPRETGFGFAGSAAAETPAVEDHSPEEGSTPPSETHERLVSLLRSDAPAEEDLRPAARPVEIVDECLVVETCIDEYLWALYERTPKVDVNKVTKQINTTVRPRRARRRPSPKPLRTMSSPTSRGRIRSGHKKPVCRSEIM